MIGIMGYTDCPSYRPGEIVRPRFSVEDGSVGYTIDVIRLIDGDDGNRPYAWSPIDAMPTFQLAGRKQPIPAGSYAVVEKCPPIRMTQGVTLVLLAYPTRLWSKARQCLISRKDSALGVGLELSIAPTGALEFNLEAAGRICTLATQPPQQNSWHMIAAVIDPAADAISLCHRLIKNGFNAKRSIVATARLSSPLTDLPKGVLTIAADRVSDADAVRAVHHFDGKIEAPMFFAGDRMAEVLTLANGTGIIAALRRLPGLICGWDFSLGIDTAEVRSTGDAEADGYCVNHPTRAVTGADWNGQETDWRRRPDHYGAIHFHTDDLADCDWSSDCALPLPADLDSGIYAVRARSTKGAEDVAPFFVVGSGAQTPRRLAFLASTYTYLAYANSRHGYEDALSEPAYGAILALTPTDVFLNQRRDLGVSLYDRHLDGAGACISSWRRPILNMRPDGKLWNFSADLHIIGWLERLGIPYDIVTDDVLHQDGAKALAPYHCLITGSHPEYHTAATLDGLQSWLESGGRLFYAGGNGFYWKVATSTRFPGAIEVRRGETGTRCFELPPGERHHQFDGEFGGLWRANGRPPQALTGIGFVAEGFDSCSYYERTASSDDPRAQFVFAGLRADERIGDFGMLGGAAGLELDAADRALGTPEHALVLARSVGHSNVYLVTPEVMISTHPYVDSISNPLVRAEMTFFEMASGGAVFSTGSISWSSSLNHNGYDNNVAKISSNVVRRFLDPTPFAPPSGAS